MYCEFNAKNSGGLTPPPYSPSPHPPDATLLLLILFKTENEFVVDAEFVWLYLLDYQGDNFGSLLKLQKEWE